MNPLLKLYLDAFHKTAWPFMPKDNGGISVPPVSEPSSLPIWSAIGRDVKGVAGDAASSVGKAIGTAGSFIRDAAKEDLNLHHPILKRILNPFTNTPYANYNSDTVNSTANVMQGLVKKRQLPAKAPVLSHEVTYSGAPIKNTPTPWGKALAHASGLGTPDFGKKPLGTAPSEEDVLSSYHATFPKGGTLKLYLEVFNKVAAGLQMKGLQAAPGLSSGGLPFPQGALSKGVANPPPLTIGRNGLPNAGSPIRLVHPNPIHGNEQPGNLLKGDTAPSLADDMKLYRPGGGFAEHNPMPSNVVTTTPADLRSIEARYPGTTGSVRQVPPATPKWTPNPTNPSPRTAIGPGKNIQGAVSAVSNAAISGSLGSAASAPVPPSNASVPGTTDATNPETTNGMAQSPQGATLQKDPSRSTPQVGTGSIAPIAPAPATMMPNSNLSSMASLGPKPPGPALTGTAAAGNSAATGQPRNAPPGSDAYWGALFRHYHGTAFDPNSHMDRTKMMALQHQRTRPNFDTYTHRYVGQGQPS